MNNKDLHNMVIKMPENMMPIKVEDNKSESLSQHNTQWERRIVLNIAHIDLFNEHPGCATWKTGDNWTTDDGMNYHGAESQKWTDYDSHQDTFSKMSMDPSGMPHKLRGPHEFGNASLPSIADEEKVLKWTTTSNSEMFSWTNPLM